MTLPVLSLVVGFSLAGTILYLVRRDHLHGPYALGWLLLAAMVIVVAIVPASIDWVGRAVGIYYPPILLCLLAIAALLIKSLVSDLERSRQERTVRRLSQKLAILEQELAELRSRQGLPPVRRDHDSDGG
jgi:ABC-type Fe3+-siderophore transport system permease subunit